MEKTWFCTLKEDHKSITVGDKLTLNCKGEALERPFKNQSLSLQTKKDHSLVLLKSLQTGKDSLSLQVTSYRTGIFEPPFLITDGMQSLKVNNLSFEVQSLLTEKDSKAHPAFGPFLTQNPYFLFSVFFGCLFFSILALFFYRFLKRTFFVKRLLKKRSTKSPSQTFVLSLRKEEEDRDKAVFDLEKNFKIFLEARLLINAKTQKSIMKELKKYQAQIFKKYGLNIKQLLQEFEQKDEITWNHKSFIKLKKLSQELVFLIEEELA